MTKTVTHINCPKEWESTCDWDSHKPALFMALYKTTGIVAELGCGYGSTGFIKEFCDKYDRFFYSYDTNEDWVKKMNGNTALISDYITDIKMATKVDVLFIDCAPGEIRKDLIKKLANRANVILVHDSEIGAEYVYGMSEILSTFKYRLDYQPEGKPHTAAVSNFVDVTKWVE